MKKYMLDTNIINRILDQKLDLKIFKNPLKKFFVTHVQKNEIKNTPDTTRRNELLKIFEEVANSIPTESALWGKSNWGESKWAEDNLVEKILDGLNKKKKKNNNPEDALIADTAFKNNCVLLTEDDALYEVVNNIFNGSVQKLDEFKKSN